MRPLKAVLISGVYAGKGEFRVKLIRTEYDAYNRRFKLLDKADADKLRDGEIYLFTDFSDEDLKQPPHDIEPAGTQLTDFVLKQH